MHRLVMACIALMLFSVLAARADDLQAFLDATVKTAREAYHLPAMATVIQIDGKIAAESAIGVRAQGRPEMVTTRDLWAIGSDTKAMTATMIARLVERGVMSFDDTLATCFPDVAPTMHAAYRGVTMKQLLSHMAGLPGLEEDTEFVPFLTSIKGITDVRAQRAALAKFFLVDAPALPPGTQFKYSNLGYMLAGAAAERRTGKSWEELVRAEVFAPLGITQAGFGAPGVSAAIDQPRGHEEKNGAYVPIDAGAENAAVPLVIGPAGLVHISLHDWLKFAQDQMDGAHGRGKLLKPETYRALHTPISSTGVYALGWGAKLGPDGVPLVLTHSGSDGYWFADIRIWPKHNIIALFVTNAGTDEGAGKAIKQVRDAVQAKLRPVD